MINSICSFIYLAVLQAADIFAGRVLRMAAARDERGQASAEYALVLMAAAALAIVFGTWAVKNDTISSVFSRVLETILGDMG